MARYVLVALNGAAPGSDPEELERWYEEVHIPDLLSCKGIKSARRYKTVRGLVPGQEPWANVAIYEIEIDDLAEVSADMQAKLRPFHPAFDRTRSAHLFAVETAAAGVEG